MVSLSPVGHCRQIVAEQSFPVHSALEKKTGFGQKTIAWRENMENKASSRGKYSIKTKKQNKNKKQ